MCVIRIAFILLALLATGGAQTQVSANWPQFRNTPALTGVATTVLPPSLRQLWTYEAGGAVESSAAVVDGTVYVGSASGELHAVDLASGKMKWKYRAVSQDYGIGDSSPAVA